MKRTILHLTGLILCLQGILTLGIKRLSNIEMTQSKELCTIFLGCLLWSLSKTRIGGYHES